MLENKEGTEKKQDIDTSHESFFRDTIQLDISEEDMRRAAGEDVPLSDDELSEESKRSRKQKNKEATQSNAKILIKDILIACAIALVISLIVKPTIVRETSMEPTVEPNDYILVNKQAYTFGDIDRGDIIVFKSELKLDETHNKLLIKRVVAIPGDVISITDGKVYLNGAELDEPYIAEGGTPGEVLNLTIPEGKIFVMGDHRTVSVDSRALGLIDIDTVVGKAFFRLYPFKNIGAV